MMALWIISGFLLLLLIALLFSPMVLYINSESELYYFQIAGLIRIRILLQDDSIKLRVTLLFVPFTIDPSKWIGRNEKKGDSKKTQKKKKKSSKKHRAIFFNKIKLFGRFGIKVLKSFKIRQFRLDFDTDDFILNAKLLPVVTCINNQYKNVLITVNFFEQNMIILEIRNRLIKLVYLSFKYLVFEMRKVNKK